MSSLPGSENFDGLPKAVPMSSAPPTLREKSLFFISKNENDIKWQRAKMVVGAFEIKSEPFFQPKEDMKPRYKGDDTEMKTKFEEALQAWEDFKLRKGFIKACNDLPDTACCCGLISHSDSSSTIKQYASLLNDGWMKYANKKLKSRGFKIDAFHWNWHNTTGKSETNILLIRFFELSTYKFRQAFQEGSLDLDDMLIDEEDKDSSHYSVSHNSCGKVDDPIPAAR